MVATEPIVSVEQLHFLWIGQNPLKHPVLERRSAVRFHAMIVGDQRVCKRLNDVLVYAGIADGALLVYALAVVDGGVFVERFVFDTDGACSSHGRYDCGPTRRRHSFGPV